MLITTNFDRLIEKALEEAGVAPNVLSSEDQIQGMVPLIHTPNCLIKLHGDYLDTRIRNTFEELTEYPAAMDTLLDRVFDEFGLIVCGWSANWDVALTSALFRASSRRYTIYWAVHGRASDKAQQLISHRGAQAIDIADADTFFSAVQQKGGRHRGAFNTSPTIGRRCSFKSKEMPFRTALSNRACRFSA